MFLVPRDHLLSIHVLPWLPFRLATIVFREPFYILHYFNASRRMRKARLRTAKDIEMKAMEKKVVYEGPFRTKLEEVLALEEAVLVIASQLHYYELVRLGRTSKAIRELIFPHRDLVIRKAKLRRVAQCAKAERACWNCNTPVCIDDGSSIAVATPSKRYRNKPIVRYCGYTLGNEDASSIYRHREICQYEHHNKNCDPYCSWCYYTKISRNLRAAKRQSCECPSYPSGDILCPNCILLSEPWKLKDEAMAEVVRRRTLDVRKCHGCDMALRGNRIWWICRVCKKQCTNRVHAVDRGAASKDIEAL